MAFTEEEEQALRGLLAVERTKSASFSDDMALLAPGLYPEFDPDGHRYVRDERFVHGGTLYRVLQDHTSQSDWTPENAPSLYAKVLVAEEGQVIEWSPIPPGSDGFPKGQVVTHNGKTWESQVDHNVWEPGATGVGENIWKDITEGA